MKETKGFLRYLLLVYFLLPYFIFFLFYRFSFQLNIPDFWWALRNSITQSTLAALIAVAAGIPISLGIFSLRPSSRDFFKKLLMVPQIFPALYSVLIAFSVLNPFPMGLTGVVVIYVLINAGLAAVFLHNAAQAKLGNLATISEVYGLGKYSFFRQVYFRLLGPDLVQAFFLVFIFCFSSFSVPLIAGGGRGTNLEVLIFEKIFIEQNWSAAFSIGIFQMCFVFLISYLLLKKETAGSGEFFDGSYLKSGPGLLIAAIYLMIYFGGYGAGLIQSFAYGDFIKEYSTDLFAVTRDTLRILFVYLAVNFFLLYAWLLDLVRNGRLNPAAHLVSPSTVIAGFAFYLAFPPGAAFDVYKLAMVMSILLFPVLYRIFLQPAVEAIRPQIQIAVICGIPSSRIVVDVILRQLRGTFFSWVSFLIIWFLSDYAILRAAGVQTQTTGIFSESFLTSYRLPLSYLMSFYILILGAMLVFLIYLLIRMADVAYKKFIL